MAFDALVVAGGDSVYSAYPIFSVPHTHTEAAEVRLRLVAGTHASFWIQAQQVDVWGNKSRFSFRKVDF
jgi:hypothetical protein